MYKPFAMLYNPLMQKVPAGETGTVRRKNTMNEVFEFLKECGTYYLATLDGDQPHVRPFGTIDCFEDRLYIQTGKVKEVSRQMKANPKIEISGMARGRWIRLQAEAVLDERVEAQEHMLASYPSLQRMYKPGDGNTEVFYLKNVTARICSFTDPEEVYRF